MEDRFNIDAGDPTPIYAQLERAIRFAIATERLRVGEQLPTVRQLAVDLKINANTVARVYTELERVGILETRRGVGTFVRARQDGILMRASKQSRERELRAFADRILAEAHNLGFSLDEVVDHLVGRRKKGE
ncbi:MAG: GntR family transcriptional regulator [Blastocatellia bacterium]|nr:GntR family transcriptional regulator [Blastocatellia bacterium]